MKSIFIFSLSRPLELLVATLNLSLVISSAMPGIAQADDAPAHCLYANIATLPIQFADQQPTIDGRINGKPARFLFSSASDSASLTRAAAEKWKLQLKHSDIEILGSGGESQAYRALVDEIGFGKWTWHHKTFDVIYDMTYSADYDASIGADFLFQHDVELRLADHEIKFFEPVNCKEAFLAYWDANASVVPIEEIFPFDKRQTFTVEINNQKFLAMIGTGTQTTVINRTAAALLGFSPNKEGVTKLDELGAIGKHKLESWVMQFQSFSMGDETIKNPKLRVADLDKAGQIDTNYMLPAEYIDEQPQIILGTDFLRAHRVLFALSQRQMYFSYLGGPVFGPYEEHKSVAEKETP